MSTSTLAGSLAFVLAATIGLTAANAAQAGKGAEIIVDKKNKVHRFRESSDVKRQAAAHEAAFRAKFDEVWKVAESVISQTRRALDVSQRAGKDAAAPAAVRVDATTLTQSLAREGTWMTTVDDFALQHAEFDNQRCFVRVSRVRVARPGARLAPAQAMQEFKKSFRNKQSWHYEPNLDPETMICSPDNLTFIHETYGLGFHTAVIERWTNGGQDMFSYWYETEKPQRIAVGIDAAFAVAAEDGKTDHVVLITVFVHKTDYTAKQHSAFRTNTEKRVGGQH